MNHICSVVFAAVLLLCVTYSCTSATSGDAAGADPQVLPLVNGIVFRLGASEQVSDSARACQAMWDGLYARTSEQVPLFRCIEGDSAMIFVGLPVRTTLRRLEELNIFGLPDDSVESEREEGVFFYKRHQTDSLTAAEYCQQFENALVCLVATATDSVHSGRLFSREAIANRFKQE